MWRWLPKYNVEEHLSVNPKIPGAIHGLVSLYGLVSLCWCMLHEFSCVCGRQLYKRCCCVGSMSPFRKRPHIPFKNSRGNPANSVLVSLQYVIVQCPGMMWNPRLTLSVWWYLNIWTKKDVYVCVLDSSWLALWEVPLMMGILPYAV